MSGRCTTSRIDGTFAAGSSRSACASGVSVLCPNAAAPCPIASVLPTKWDCEMFARSRVRNCSICEEFPVQSFPSIAWPGLRFHLSLEGQYEAAAAAVPAVLEQEDALPRT